ncbi:MAG: hypothetical protein AUK47_17535 [Deltaproteobacteria bacterium CG2_30_63_29]|nr:MAG: hypothetical protein AUK47_17535 [Deltaproteobacteria bacterium CG2_30_63_29]
MSPLTPPLKDLVLVVTGGSGSIGSAICRAATRDGAKVAFTYHEGEERAHTLAAELGQGCLVQQVEGTDAAAISAFVQRVETELGPISVLVNNVGLSQVMPFALIDEDDWDQTISVNLKSLFLFTKAVVRGMIRRKHGVILNLGSLAGHRLLEVPVHYATAKAGVRGFTLSLAKELSRYGIRVNEITPGLIQGGIGASASERQLADYNQFCAMGRPGTPEEVAELAVFLASSRASYLNAQSFVIDGGL